MQRRGCRREAGAAPRPPAPPTTRPPGGRRCPFFLVFAAALGRGGAAHPPLAGAGGQVRISVSNLDLDFLNGLGPLKAPLMELFKDVVS